MLKRNLNGGFAFGVYVVVLTCRAVSLASILSKRTLAPTKLDEIKIKANILGAFIAEKSETIVGRDSDEL